MEDYTEGTYERFTYKKYSGYIEISECNICEPMAVVVIPDEIAGLPVTRIGALAFHKCLGIIEITIPDSVIYIGSNAFENLRPERIIIENPKCKPNSIGEMTTIYGCENSAAQAYAKRYNKKFVSIGSAVDYTKGKCEQFKYKKYSGHIEISRCDVYAAEKVVIPAEIEGLPVTSIGYRAFKDCSSLTDIIIPDSVKWIGREAFSYCSSLTDITIPDSVTSIGDCAFENCSNLKSITIPDSVTSIGEYAFFYCSSLAEITIPDSIASIKDGVFKNCTGLTSITIPDSAASIGNRAFSFCSSLKDITIPDSVASIGNSAFMSCKNLTSATIPDSVTSIGEWAFRWCLSLESIAILNPECKICDSEDTIYEETEIQGYDNSTAQAYAEKYGRKFVSLGKAPDAN